MDVNSNLPSRVMSSLKDGLDDSLVQEFGSGLTLSFSRGRGESSRLPVELVAVDEGVPVLIYAIAVLEGEKWRLDEFVVDRLDGEDLSDYAVELANLMIVENGVMKDGADLRGVYVVG
ncbi:hypothetical protein ABE493_13785 [Stenotrophomonas terrae]|uniref:hypothetical protein n=1 Tax=Stenotrophomonas terrae TaxID=405446 RepID=UPI00320B4EFC